MKMKKPVDMPKKDPVTHIIQEQLHVLGYDSTIRSLIPVNGGSINQAWQVKTGNQSYFCKANSATKFPHLFHLEKKGLELVKSTGQIKTPEVIGHFEKDDHQLLLMEWIETGVRSKKFWTSFGMQLAALHQVKDTSFGQDYDNYMGSVPQQNHKKEKWTHFFISQRLQPMIHHCIRAALLQPKHLVAFEKLFEKLSLIFDDSVKPSLVHGDLWSGNFMCNKNGEPVLIDPAVYFGHPAVDLGMTTLFGGFEAAFYEAYKFHSPFPPGHMDQWQVCNLYPLLIHLFLFGKHYLPSIERTLQQFA